MGSGRKGLVRGQSFGIVLLVVAGFFMLVMLGTPFFAPAGMTYDSLLMFFSQSAAQLFTSETLAGVFLLIIALVFAIILFGSTNTIRRF